MGVWQVNLIGVQGLKPLFLGPVIVAAEAATHKDHLWDSLIATGSRSLEHF
jgi:hypothetical protein